MDKIKFALKHKKAKQEQVYWDFVVNGKSLLDYLYPVGIDLISPFGWIDNKEYEQQILREFCVEILPESENDRTMFYVCPECADISCGAITGKIVENAEGYIVWKDFGYENDYEGILERYDNVSFSFEKTHYLHTIKQLFGKI